MKDFKESYGYCEIDNHRDYSICVNPHDQCLYGKSAHYCWDKIDTDDEKYFPNQRIKLARQHIGNEIMLNASGSRKTTEAAAYLHNSSLDSIPECFQQNTYASENGCVWLSACLLMNTVDSDISTVMIERYQQDEGKFE